MGKREKQKLKFTFINPNTDEETVAFLEKFIPEMLYRNYERKGVSLEKWIKSFQKL